MGLDYVWVWYFIRTLIMRIWYRLTPHYSVLFHFQEFFYELPQSFLLPGIPVPEYL